MRTSWSAMQSYPSVKSDDFVIPLSVRKVCWLLSFASLWSHPWPLYLPSESILPLQFSWNLFVNCWMSMAHPVHPCILFLFIQETYTPWIPKLVWTEAIYGDFPESSPVPTLSHVILNRRKRCWYSHFTDEGLRARCPQQLSGRGGNMSATPCDCTWAEDAGQQGIHPLPSKHFRGATRASSFRWLGAWKWQNLVDSLSSMIPLEDTMCFLCTPLEKTYSKLWISANTSGRRWLLSLFLNESFKAVALGYLISQDMELSLES